MGVGLRLKIALRERKMTIKELSAESGISLNTLYSITKRDTENVDDVILNTISEMLGLSWAFFCSCSPFEDLEFLQQNKETILLQLEKYGSFSRQGRNLSDVSNYELWKQLSNNVIDISINKDGTVHVLFDTAYSPDPIFYGDVSADSLMKAYNKLDAWGRKLVIEYAELLANNPGFLSKDSSDSNAE